MHYGQLENSEWFVVSRSSYGRPREATNHESGKKCEKHSPWARASPHLSRVLKNSRVLI